MERGAISAPLSICIVLDNFSAHTSFDVYTRQRRRRNDIQEREITLRLDTDVVVGQPCPLDRSLIGDLALPQYGPHSTERVLV